MSEEEKIKQINQVIANYFEQNTKKDSVAVKELMPDFIKANIFTKDHKKGLPIRKVLRTLDEKNALGQIPFVHPERKDKNTFWYFLRTGTPYVSDTPNDTGHTKKQKAKAARANNDEHYILNLCDEILESKAARQHKFGFLLGDYHKDGKTRTALPVDAYYPALNLVIEFNDKPSTSGQNDQSDKRTISGVSRSEQRKIYSDRKMKGLKAKEIQLVVIDYSSFACDEDNQLIRDKEKDLKVVAQLLKKHQ